MHLRTAVNGSDGASGQDASEHPPIESAAEAASRPGDAPAPESADISQNSHPAPAPSSEAASSAPVAPGIRRVEVPERPSEAGARTVPVNRRESVTYEQYAQQLKRGGSGPLGRELARKVDSAGSRKLALQLTTGASVGSMAIPEENSVGTPRSDDEFRERTEIKWAKDTHGHLFFNEYIVLKSLGEGSYGKVKLCMDMKHHRLVAVKMVSKDRRKKVRLAGSSPDSSETLRQEIAVMKALDHPNMAKVFEVIDAEASSWMLMVMEHVEGGPVQSKQGDDVEILSEVTARAYFRQLLQAIDYLHANRVVHGDIKPDNLLLSSSGEGDAAHACLGAGRPGNTGIAPTQPKNDLRLSARDSRAAAPLVRRALGPPRHRRPPPPPQSSSSTSAPPSSSRRKRATGSRAPWGRRRSSPPRPAWGRSAREGRPTYGRRPSPSTCS